MLHLWTFLVQECPYAIPPCAIPPFINYSLWHKLRKCFPCKAQIRSTAPKRIFHETGPEQRSRADNRCIRIQITLRIFFVMTVLGKKCWFWWIPLFYCVLSIEIDFQPFVFITNWYHMPHLDAIRPPFGIESQDGSNGTVSRSINLLDEQSY